MQRAEGHGGIGMATEDRDILSAARLRDHGVSGSVARTAQAVYILTARGELVASGEGLSVVVVDDREHAWWAVHDALAQLPGWAVGPCTYHGEVALWQVAVIDLRPRGRYAKREAITGTGATEIADLGALVALLAARRVSGR
jgi:hypothetical protein